MIDVTVCERETAVKHAGRSRQPPPGRRTISQCRHLFVALPRFHASRNAHLHTPFLRWPSSLQSNPFLELWTSLHRHKSSNVLKRGADGPLERVLHPQPAAAFNRIQWLAMQDSGASNGDPGSCFVGSWICTDLQHVSQNNVQRSKLGMAWKEGKVQQGRAKLGGSRSRGSFGWALCTPVHSLVHSDPLSVSISGQMTCGVTRDERSRVLLTCPGIVAPWPQSGKPSLQAATSPTRTQDTTSAIEIAPGSPLAGLSALRFPSRKGPRGHQSCARFSINCALHPLRLSCRSTKVHLYPLQKM